MNGPLSVEKYLLFLFCPQYNCGTISNFGRLDIVFVDEQTERKRILKPMTKEEWEKKQKELRHEVDPETGRKR